MLIPQAIGSSSSLATIPDVEQDVLLMDQDENIPTYEKEDNYENMYEATLDDDSQTLPQ